MLHVIPLQQTEWIPELWLLSESLDIKAGLWVEGSISTIQVALYRWFDDHRTPDDGLKRNLHGNLRVLYRQLCLRCLGWLTRTRELGSLCWRLRSRPLGLGSGWHKVSGWPSGGIPALRRRSTLRWGNGGVRSRWRRGASNGGLLWSRHRRGWWCGKTSSSLFHGRNGARWLFMSSRCSQLVRGLVFSASRLQGFI